MMQKNGQFIRWKHIQDLYEKMNQMAVQSKGLSLLPKLKLEHIELTSYSRMRVDLAAQVIRFNIWWTLTRVESIYVCLYVHNICLRVFNN